MGYMRHHAIVVTSWDKEALTKAHAQAQKMFDPVSAACVSKGSSVVSAVVDAGLNGYRSFLIAPDGSKEGWPESDAYDLARAEFVKWLNAQRHEDGSTLLQFAEVFFGDSGKERAAVLATSDDKL